MGFIDVEIEQDVTYVGELQLLGRSQEGSQMNLKSRISNCEGIGRKV